MEYTLPALPYTYNALEPIISERTVSFHYGKHTKTYIDNLNKLIIGTEYESKNLEEIIKTSEGAIFNNAAQTLNHLFYFGQFIPPKVEESHGDIKKAIEKKYLSIENFKKLFSSEGVSIFGSGWIWLTTDDRGNLSIEKGSNAENPLQKNLIPLLTFDVWEHAYYLDYQNRRADHLNEIWKIVNWDIIEKRYQSVIDKVK
ncbi:MAG: superoxide dismutase [Bacteroidales bacterium]